MSAFNQRLKALELRVINAVEATPAIVQIVHGERTPEQQTEYDRALVEGVFVVSIGIKDCSRKEKYDEVD
jgi:hypothetical protein